MPPVPARTRRAPTTECLACASAQFKCDLFIKPSGATLCDLNFTGDDAANCNAALNCARRTNCVGDAGDSPRYCYCGSDLSTCTAPDGPCKAELEQAQGTTVPKDVYNGLFVKGISTPGGAALKVYNCAAQNCEACRPYCPK